MKTFAAVLAAAALAAPALAACPNLCNGHGSCTSDDKCECWAGYTGYDCSQRACPQTEAWAVDSAEGAHVYAECAGKGLCDYTTGLCECFPGYEGRACERSACPSDCSGHGKCRVIADLPTYSAGFDAGTSLVANSYNWDEKAISACVCDGGYMGPDCSQRYCPFGDDPMTVCEQGDTEQVQVITVDIPVSSDLSTSPYDNAAVENAADNFAVRYTTTDNKKFYTGAFDLATIGTADVNAAGASADSNAAAALEALPNFAVKDVTAHSTFDTDSTTASLAVTFLHESTGNSFGAQNLMECPHARNVGKDSNGVTLTTYGCGKEGCQPVILQPRITHTFFHADGSGFGTDPTTAKVKFTAESVLTCPAGASCDMTGVDFTGGVMVLIKSGKIWVGGLGAANVQANIGGYTDAAAYNAGESSPLKYYGEITNHPAYGANKEVDISQIMADTSLEIDTSASDGFYSLQYVPARCNAATDITVDAAAAGGVWTGEPLDNLDVENIECSGRGQCDRSSGNCQCFEGYTGLACGEQTILI
jgi:hypothetical protein